jgi:hypothetical protein
MSAGRLSAGEEPKFSQIHALPRGHAACTAGTESALGAASGTVSAWPPGEMIMMMKSALGYLTFATLALLTGGCGTHSNNDSRARAEPRLCGSVERVPARL